MSGSLWIGRQITASLRRSQQKNDLPQEGSGAGNGTQPSGISDILDS
jgi:hypothetical protein